MSGETVREMTFDEVVDRIGFGAFQRKLLVICGAGWAADAMEVPCSCYHSSTSSRWGGEIG